MKFTTRCLTAMFAKALSNVLLRGCPAILLVAGATAPSVLAQASAGMTGTVTDASGAVVSGAAVTITNTGTSQQTRTTTSSAGTYAATGLAPGSYSLTVEGAGFKKSVQTAIRVEVSVTSTIDVTLSTGSASDTVEVTANSIAFNTTQPQLGSTIEPEVVAALPNAVSGRGRQIDALQFLAPGTTGSHLLAPRLRRRRLRAGDRLQRCSRTTTRDGRVYHQLQPTV